MDGNDPADLSHRVSGTLGGRTQFAREEFRATAWLDKRATATILPPLLQSTLDAGEAAAIALATSEGIGTVAIDEQLRDRSES